MKKIIFLLLTVLIVSCSSSDDPNPVPSCWDSPSFVGTWSGTDEATETPTTITLVFNDDATGSIATVGELDSETYNAFTWGDVRDIDFDANKEGTLTLNGYDSNIGEVYQFLGCNQFRAYKEVSDGTEADIIVFDKE